MRVANPKGLLNVLVFDVNRPRLIVMGQRRTAAGKCSTKVRSRARRSLLLLPVAELEAGFEPCLYQQSLTQPRG